MVATAQRRNWVRDVAVLGVLALVLLAVRAFVVVPVAVQGESMAPTVTAGEVALVSHLTDVDHGLRRGDLVVFDDPQGTVSLKRVVGLPGDRVALVDAVLEVDGRAVDEPYVDHSRITGTYFGPVMVPAGHVLVLGDNRSQSIDSRDYGAVAVDRIVGRVLAHW